MSSPATGFCLRGVCVEYGASAALREVDLEIEPGEVVAFVGPSGAGKSTALGLCNGMVCPTSGTVRLDGEDLCGLPAARLRALRSRIGLIPQELGLVGNLRVSQNVLAGRLGRRGALAGLRPLIHARRGELTEVLEILDRLGIGEKLFHRVDTLSGGERQRVAIARALYQEAGVLLADEPLSALDPARARETLTLLLAVAREEGLTLILSLHDIDLARELVGRLVGLRAGRVVFDRRREDVTDDDLRHLYQLEGDERVG
ncbi:MAG: ATP-binding cassette domain-containing protein [Planctomycetota bacterium]|jgi:phosphonate transport system ATP-binding protein|nr:ATP-binding cassette domain-containing protein [Planctomycetota bacterium]MDP6989460.1 ATP-binding cassette domain-containing protein [Planctomycetota bacterium]